MNKDEILKYAGSILLEEAKHIENLSSKIDSSFNDAIDLIINSKGRIVTSGVGKSGHIANKFASTLASTGTPSFFVNPTECLHGDFGMITKDDVVIFVSRSGNNNELSYMIDYIKRNDIKLISISSVPNSTLAKSSDIFLNIYVDKEACPLNLAPTTSTTVTLALADAIATTLMKIRGFTPEEFANFHPGGSLGKHLVKVADIMHKIDDLGIVRENLTVKDVIPIIIEKKLGSVIVLEKNSDKLLGIIVDGDLKRLLVKYSEKALEKNIYDVMSKNLKTIHKDDTIGSALAIMEGKLTSLVVVDKNENLIGLVHIHDILKYKAI